jgi:lipopolysaccharide exporter
MATISELSEPIERSSEMRPPSFRTRVLRGSVLLATGSVAEQTIRLGRNMFLARLLAPEAFGTMAIAMSVSSVLHTITDLGVKEAIIQNPKGSEERYAGAAWWLAFSRAVSLYVVVFLAAPWLAGFYGNVALTSLLRVLAVGLVLDGSVSAKAYIALKEMRFGKWAALNHGGGIFGVLVTVALSFFIRDVWALVLGSLAESAARCLLSYILCPYLPSLSWDRNAFIELLRFSRGLFGLAFFNLIFARADIFVLAKLYPAGQLGLYSMAVGLAQAPAGFIMNVQGQTLLPAFSQIQTDNARVNRTFLQTSALIVALGIPTFAFLALCGHSLLTISYGRRYGAAAGPFIVAAAVGLLNIVNGQPTIVFFAKGLPRLHRRSVAITAIIVVAAVYPFTKMFGLAGPQLACLAAMATGYALQVERMHLYTGLNLRQYGKMFVLPVLASASVGGVWLAGRPFAALARPVPNTILGIVGCLLAYSIAGVALLRSRGRLL